MKRIIILFCVITVLLLGISGCNTDEEGSDLAVFAIDEFDTHYYIRICEDETYQSITLFYTVTAWGDEELPPGPAPIPNVITQQVTCGDVINLGSDYGIWANLGPMTIKEIHDEHVVVHFKANGIAPVSPGGGIPVFREPYWVVDITYGERYFVATDSASSGLSFTFVFEKSLEVDENNTPLSVPTITIQGEEFSVFSSGLDLGNMNLTNTDLEPLKYMVNLVELNLSGNEISDIEPLRYLVNLESLFIYRTQIEDISTLSDLTNLRSLSLCDNPIYNISALSELTNLVMLRLNRTDINDINSLGSLTNLRNLYLSDNPIYDISALSELTDLQTLELSNTLILQENTWAGNVDALSNLTNLQRLILRRNNLSSAQIEDISTLTNLRGLYLCDNPIYDISALGELTNLTTLWLNRTDVDNINSLRSLADLRHLNLSDNPIYDIRALSELAGLRTLDLSNTLIMQENTWAGNVDVLSNLTNLRSLILQHNNISSAQIEELKSALPNRDVIR